MRRCGKIAAAMAAVFVLVLWPGCTLARGNMDEPARALFDHANEERVSRGIRPLKWDASLAEAARLHAMKMAEEETLSHRLPGEADLPTREKDAGAKMSAAAENIASGPSVEGLHRGWMNSPPHRRNLLNPQYDSVGIAVVQRGEIFWAVQDFAHVLADLSLAEQERLVAKAVQAAGLAVRFDNSDARRVCEGRQPSNSDPRMIVKFSSTDLSAMPESFEGNLRSASYSRAEIGACTKPATDGLREYHIAVLLY